MRSRLRLLWARLLAACFLSRCLGCKTWTRASLCPACETSLSPFPDDACPRCLGHHASCPLEGSPLSHIYALAPYQGALRKAIHALKFEARLDLPLWLGPRMARRISHLEPDWLIVPVPLSNERLRSRGYNQAELLALCLDRRVDAHLLRRIRATSSQVGHTRTERWEGMRDAFEAAPTVSGQRILLVDDVLTTGATLTWAAHALRAAGAREVRALVAARTPLLHQAAPR